MRAKSQQCSIRRSLHRGATRLGLREGFAVDLTTARANGTMWDLSLEDDKAELRRVQNREQPELLVGSPSSDEFSSLLSTRAATVQSLCTELHVAGGNAKNTLFMDIRKIPVRGRCLRFNPSSMTRECTASMVQCVAGV